jgi:hypothetical protein
VRWAQTPWSSVVVVAGLGRLDKKEKKKKRKKTHTFVVLGSVSGVVGMGVVGEVAGAAMGDQGGGRGCGTPIQKEKKKGKKKLTFFGYPYRVWWVGTWWAQPGRLWCFWVVALG